MIAHYQGRLTAVRTSRKTTNSELLAAVQEAFRRVERGDKIKPRLLDVKDAGRYLGVSDKVIRQLIMNGELAYVQRIPGRSPYLVAIEDLDNWIAQHKLRA